MVKRAQLCCLCFVIDISRAFSFAVCGGIFLQYIARYQNKMHAHKYNNRNDRFSQQQQKNDAQTVQVLPGTHRHHKNIHVKTGETTYITQLDKPVEQSKNTRREKSHTKKQHATPVLIALIAHYLIRYESSSGYETSQTTEKNATTPSPTSEGAPFLCAIEHDHSSTLR